MRTQPSLQALAARLAGVNVEDIAQRAGVSTRTVYRIRRGELPSAKTSTVDALNRAIDDAIAEALSKRRRVPGMSAPRKSTT